MPYTPPTVSFVTLYPRAPGATDYNDPSYLDIAITSQSVLNPAYPSSTLYDAWCLDNTLNIGINATYTASIYSSYELSVLQNSPMAGDNFIAHYSANLDNINWLLNYNYTAAGYTSGDVQAAIWQMVGESVTSGDVTALGPYTPANVTSLVSLALAVGDGYLPAAGGTIGVILDPVDSNGNHAQPLIMETKAAALGDFVWEDKNANGLQDAGETGIAGVAVQLVRDLNGDGIISANEVLASGTTDANGIYNFTGLTPGLDYQVRFAQASGYDGVSPRQVTGSATSGSDSDGLLTDVVKLAPAETNLSLDAGFYKTAKLGDRVWVDSNANGIQDAGEANLPGVLVHLYNASNVQVATATTDANGLYLFSGLVPGTYTVKFDAPTGYVFTTKDANNNTSDAVDSDADSTGRTGTYTLASGETNLTVDAGLIAQRAHIGDFVFEDKNGNGIQDTGETGITGAVVTLCDANGNPVSGVAPVTTGADGSYGFDVTPGTYSIKVTAPTGYVATTKDVGGNTATSDLVDSDIDSTGKTGNYTLVNGQTNNSVDAGFYKAASLGDRVWIDANGNGLQDAGEAGVSGVVVTLLNAAGTAVSTQNTDANGNYLFTGLAPGSYSVQFASPTGYVFTTKDANANASDAIDSDADTVTGKTGTYVLNSGDNNLTVDAGIYQKAHIGDFVFEDKNGNGIQDTGETGITGATVTLCDANGNPVVGVATVTTGANGSYGFDVAPGTYSVKVTAPTGYVATTKDVGGNTATSDLVDSDIDSTGKTGNYTLTTGQTNNSVDAGFYKTASLGDRVWFDTNGNGLQDTGEAGASGLIVKLLDANGVVQASQTTDANGNYLFTNLSPGSYSVQFAAPTGYSFTTKDANANGSDTIDSDADTVTGKTGSYTLNSGDVNTTVDAGLVAQRAHIGDFVFEDKNGNGIQDTGETGITGAVVTLCDANGNPVSGVAPVTTGADGSYGFDVTPGTYSIKVTAPTGYVATTKDVGGNTATSDLVDSDIDSTGKTGNYTIANGQTNNSVDAGFYKAASLGDRVWIDANGNGLQDAGEAGVSGVVVTLLNAAGTAVSTQNTDANGNYLFTGLAPGSYSVQFASPTGYVFTTKDANANASDAIDSDADTVTGKTGTYVLNSGDNNLTVDAGIYQKAHIGDFVFEDKNGNGIQDTGETGITGATVTLCDANGNPVAGVATVTTGADGSYGFDVAPGTYSIKVTAPTGYVATTKDVGGNTVASDAVDSDIDSTGKTVNYTLTTGQTNNTVDAGFYKTASIGDRVWFDANGNGLQDTGELGAGGVTVSLLNAAGTVVATQTTSAAGAYLFSNLAPGSYSVQFAAPTGYAFTTKDANANGSDAIDSDADTVTGKTGSYTLNSGDVNTTVDAGLVPSRAHIGDRVWVDDNGNGVQDAGEVGLANVTVNLKNAAGTVVASTTTDASGIYGFDVAPGTYSVQVATPTGYVVTTKDVGGNTATSDLVDSDIDATGNTGLYTIAAGQNNVSVDAGLYKTASMGDFIWYDKNANGIQDAGEAGIAGVKVDLYNNATGTIVATTTTATNGSYLFTGLAPGSYHADVQESTLPAGFIFTKANQGTNDAVDSDVETLNGTVPLQWGIMANTTLTSGEVDRTWDAGAYKIGIDVQKYVSGTTCTTTTTTGTEGADCNYWKNACASSSSTSWGVTGSFFGFPVYGWVTTTTPTGWAGVTQCHATDSFNSVFGVNCTNGNKSIYDVLCSTSTSAYDLAMKESVSAYLNACHGSVDYAFSKEQVCAQVQSCMSTGSYSHTYNLFCAEDAKGCNWSDGKGSATCTVDTTLYDADSPPGLQVKTGSIVTFTYIVKNTGDTPLSHITLTDDRIQTVTYVSGDTNNNGLLDLTETWTYKATEVAQAGTIMNIGTVVGTDSVGGVSTVTAQDPAYYTGTGGLKGSIGDRVWYDKDSDGIQDTGETGVAGVKVTLKGAGADGVFGTADDITATTTTGANGNYLFSNLDAGKYQVVFGTKDGYVFTKANQGTNDAVDSDADSTTGTTGVITLGSGEQNLSVDAGLRHLGIDVQKYVSGTTTTTTTTCGGEGASVTWWKTNCTYQANLGCNGWTNTNCKATDSFNTVFGTNCDAAHNKSMYDVLCGTSTAAIDVYQRECVAAYLNSCHTSVDYAFTKAQVCADAQYSFGCSSFSESCNSFQHENNLGCNFSTPKTNVNCTVDTQLYDADAAPGLQVTTGSLVTFTYIVKNTGDTALSHVSLTDDRIATVTYVSGDANNNGLLDVNETWTYKATETAQAGTIQNIGTVTATDTIGTSSVTASDPAFYTGTGATKGSIGDRLWIDKNYNGLQDTGETGLAGVKVVLKGAGADGVFGTADDITATTTTSATGSYLFSNLEAGKYQLDFSDASRLGYVATKANIGTNDAIDSDVDTTGKTAVISLAAGQQNLTVDAGAYQTASVGDKVWQDSNHNNLQDAGEAGIGGITVKLLDATSLAVLATTTTNSSGNYLFSGLVPGNYVLQFDKTNVMYSGVNMNTWKWGVKDVGTNDAIDSDVAGDGIATTNVSKTDAFTLVSGQADMTRDAAITPLVINLDGKGIHTVSLEDSTGSFDLFGNGHAVQSGWIASGSGFLAIDKNGNGSIDSVNELFGGSAKGSGYASLAAYDSNGDGVVDARDAEFAKLLIWQDLNGDHVSSANELMTLAQAGIASLSLNATDLQFLDAQGNVHGDTSLVTTTAGTTLDMTDVYFAVGSADAQAAGVALPTVADLLGSNTLDTLVGPAAPVTTQVTTQVAAAHTEEVAATSGEAAEMARKLTAMQECHAATANA